MKFGIPAETRPLEKRVAVTPETIKKLTTSGLHAVIVQSGAGAGASIPDDQFTAAGATVVANAADVFGQADIVLKVRAPDAAEAAQLRSGQTLIGLLNPYQKDGIAALAKTGVNGFAMEALPRISRAQSMDVLSSQANIAGYKAVLMAANTYGRMMPMLMTAAGTVKAARVVIMGVGVAGLQAIATAKRLGATVEATDTRPVVKEQVESVGGKFVGVQTSEAAQDEKGYAKELSKDFYDKQAQLIKERCAANDVVITTALIGGVKAPKLITEDMVKGMKPGSVLVDLAAEGGGNCTLSEPGKTIEKYGVKICAPLNLPSQMPLHASTLYSRNLAAFVTAFWKDKNFVLDLNDEIQKGSVITHNGEVLHGPTKDAMK